MGKTVVSDANGRFDRIAERRSEAARDRARRGDRDLLAEDRAHRHFEAVERARHAQAGMAAGERAERPRHLGGMAGKVHQRLDAREHGRQRLRERSGDCDAQRGLFRR